MKAFKNKLILVLLVLLILIVVIPLIVFLILARQKDQPGGHIPSPIIALLPERVTYWPVISRDVFAYATSGNTFFHVDSDDIAQCANATPAWLAHEEIASLKEAGAELYTSSIES